MTPVERLLAKLPDARKVGDGWSPAKKSEFMTHGRTFRNQQRARYFARKSLGHGVDSMLANENGKHCSPCFVDRLGTIRDLANNNGAIVSEILQDYRHENARWTQRMHVLDHSGKSQSVRHVPLVKLPRRSYRPGPAAERDPLSGRIL